MTSAKSPLMKYTGLTDRVAEQMTYEDDVSDNKALAALRKMAALEGSNLNKPNDEDDLEEARKKCQCILAQKMARDNHDECVKAINSVSRMGLKTYYKLLKELPPSVEFQCTYKQKELDRTSIENQVVEDDMKQTTTWMIRTTHHMTTKHHNQQ